MYTYIYKYIVIYKHISKVYLCVIIAKFIHNSALLYIHICVYISIYIISDMSTSWSEEKRQAVIGCSETKQVREFQQMETCQSQRHMKMCGV